MTGPEGDPTFFDQDFPDLDTTDVEGKTLNDDLATLAKLRAEKDRTDKIAKDAAAEYRAHMGRVYERMEDEDVESIRHGGRLFVRNDPTWYSTVQDKAALRAWLEANHPEALGEPKFDEALLNRIVRACNDDKRPLPPGLGGYPRKTVAVRK